MYKLIRSQKDFESIVLSPDLPIMCDTETYGEYPKSKGGLYGTIRLFQLFQKGWNQAVLIDCIYIDILDVLKLIKPHHLVFHNASFDINTLNLVTDSTWWPKKLDDTLYLSRLNYFTKHGQGYGFYQCLKYAGLEDDFILGMNKGAMQKMSWARKLTKRQLEYAAADVIYMQGLYDSINPLVFLSEVYLLDIESLRLAIDYGRNGMPVDQNRVKERTKEYIEKLENVMDQFDDPDFNPNSPKQCQAFLGGVASTSRNELMKLVNQGVEGAQLLIDAKHYDKALSFLETYRGYNRLKGFFNPARASTGRYACTGGDAYGYINLQQVPNALHDIIVAPEGKSIIYKDYSGLELRMAASYVGEPTMGEMMIEGRDMHTETGKYILGIDRELTPAERIVSKAFTFSAIYGCSPKTIYEMIEAYASKLGYTLNDIKLLMNRWFDLYEGYREWHQIHKNVIRINGYVDIVTALGRKIRTYAFTDSVNFPIQSSSVEVTKISLAFLYSRYPDVEVINTIHDSNILLCDTVEEELWGNRLSECMVDAWDYVTKDLANPEIPMPHGYDAGPVWVFK